MIEKCLSGGMSRVFFVSAILLTIVLCDQASKAYVRGNIDFAAHESFLGGVVTLQHAENPGAFLSLGSEMDRGPRFWVFTVAVGAFLAWAAWRLVFGKSMTALATIGLSLLLAGGIGNIIDRIQKGSVTDFLMVGIGPVHTGVFNIADMVIVVGVVLMLFKPRESDKAF